ncbi:unnamed protein product, partial [Sphagnum balticum]
LPIAYMQPPIFSRTYPHSLNYGSIGFAIGHELVHGFGDMGRRFNLNGILVNWWTPTSERRFIERANCFVRQYSAYTVNGMNVSRMYGNDLFLFAQVNGWTTLGENIADNGGLNQAFRAYERYVVNNGLEPPFAGLEQYSHEQLFFLSYAQSQCRQMSADESRLQILTDEHTPPRPRINGALSNSIEFARAFKCAAGTPMNPAKKCHVW